MKRLSIVVALPLVCLSPRPGHAQQTDRSPPAPLSCFLPSECRSGLLSAAWDDEMTVPLNAELRFRGAALDAPAIPEGLSLDCRAIEGLSAPVNACRVLGLSAITAYQLAGVRMQTTTSSDAIAPEAPSVTASWIVADAEESSLLPPTRGIELVIAADGRSHTLEIGVRTGGAEHVFATGGLSGGDRQEIRAFIGDRACACEGLLDSNRVGEDAEVRVRLVDAAGNVGPWSAWLQPNDEQLASCTCAALPEDAPLGAFLLAGFALALAASRRRSNRNPGAPR